MARILFNVTAWVSAALFATTLVLWGLSYLRPTEIPVRLTFADTFLGPIRSDCGIFVIDQPRDEEILIPHLFALAIFTPLPLLAYARWREAAVRRPWDKRCPTCGYDCRATPERCPECGTVFKANAKEPSRQDPPRPPVKRGAE